MDQTYSETIDYLYSLLPNFQAEGNSAVHYSLDKIKDLCWVIGLPQWQFQSIHIAGTNGKGSVASMLSSVLQSSGHKVGLYTSPHLFDFSERIRINASPIPPQEVSHFVQENRELIQDLKPSFFELTVALAFHHFAQENVDIAIVEVGLGGRLDATNIISPELSIITNISLDHQAFLGNTLPAIAQEKAGIIKRFTPVVIGESHPLTHSVFLTHASEKEAPIYFADKELTIVSQAQKKETQVISFLKPDDDTLYTYEIDLLGEVQATNLKTVLKSIEILQGETWEIGEIALATGLRNIRRNSGLRGRMEVIQRDPLILCDTAHNLASVEQLVKHLQQSYPEARLRFVWGMAKDKDHIEVLSLLPKDAQYYFVQVNHARAMNSEVLQSLAQAKGLKGMSYQDVISGVLEAVQEQQKDEILIISGSTYVVADALKYFDQQG